MDITDLQKIAAGRFGNAASQYSAAEFVSILALCLAPTPPAPTVASATTIALQAHTSFISGAVAIATITPPPGMEKGGHQITLLPLAAFTTTTAGNVAIASTGVIGKALIMTYDPVTLKYYPSY